MKRLHLTIHGRVQGVFFRAYVKKHAKKLNLTGFVKNNNNRTVEVVAEGNEHQLEELLKYCRKGPLLSRVESIDKIGRAHV